MPLVVYTAAAAGLLWLANRFIRPLTRTAAIVLFFLPFAFTGYALVANRVYAPIDRTYVDPPLSELRESYGITGAHNPMSTDIYSQMIPWRHVVRMAVARGEWPLWNPFILSGDILAASAQSAPYSPFTLLALLMPAAISFTFTAAITFFIAGMSAFALARELGCRESVALLAAGGWMGSAAIVLYVLWPLGLSWALLPLVMTATRRAVHMPGVASFLLLTVTLTQLVLAGHPESVLHIVTLGALYGAFELAQRRSWRGLATALAAGVVTLLLCAVYLMPIAEAIPQTGEYDYRHNFFAKADRGATPVEFGVRVVTNAFPFLHLRTLQRPRMAVLKGETAVVGSIVLALAIYSMWRTRSRTTWFFGALALFCVIAGAEWKPLVKLFQKLPLFDIALHERFAFGAAFCLVMLAALGLEHLVECSDRRAAAATLAVTLAILAGGTWWLAHSWMIDDGPIDWGRWKIPAELAGLALATGVLALPRRAIVPALALLLVAQRVASDGGAWRSFPSRAAYPPVALFESMKTIREPFRIVGLQYALIPGTNALYGLEDVRGYEAMTFKRFYETWKLWCVLQPVWFNRVDDLARPILSMMNVRFAVARSDAAIPAGWVEVKRTKDAVLLGNRGALPRAFVPRNVTIGLDDGMALEGMSAIHDFGERAWITADTTVHSTANGPGLIATSRPALNEYAFDARMDADGWMVVSDCAWKGWRAYIDGRRVQTHRANVAFLGVYVPAGRHHVRLVYLPQSFVAGRTISAVALAALILFVFVARRRSRSRTGESRPTPF